ncbi:YcbK family protein [Hoeflea ulvae]|uniref:YcbK family protein n=1 Tax=Hoeflea ulvae TaxID=2983764 RepID=A0ABT3YGY5_9HYPH|nr:YcbK family protein [Hoeflea ulvae]MCY0095155.1 YcbK family protein [Hoeflea ulvae]
MFATQGFAPGAPTMMTESSRIDQADALQMATAAEAATSGSVPVPVPSPSASDADSRQAVVAESDTVGQLVMASTSIDAVNQGITQSQPAQSTANLYSAAPVVTQLAAPPAATPEPAPAPAQAQAPAAAETASAPEPEQVEAKPQVQELAVIAPPKKPSIFARLFAPQPKSAKNAPAGTKKRVVTPKTSKVVVASASMGNSGALPGVRMSAEFGPGSANDATALSSGNIQLASAAGLARLAPNGLHLQTDKVDAACFKPQLVRVLKTIEGHYKRPVVVTSGYRSPKHNRRVGGASGSRHTSCEAADIQVEGVSKWQLAKYLRTMPGRGGVGTYCHTESVHIDIGNTRDWNWRCRRRK